MKKLMTLLAFLLLGFMVACGSDQDVDQDVDRTIIFKNQTILVTPALKKSYGKGWKDIQELAKNTGAKVMSKTIDQVGSDDQLIILGLESKDKDVSEYLDRGQTVYTKELFTSTILDGELDLADDQHKIVPGPSQAKKGRGKTKAR